MNLCIIGPQSSHRHYFDTSASPETLYNLLNEANKAARRTMSRKRERPAAYTLRSEIVKELFRNRITILSLKPYGYGPAVVTDIDLSKVWFEKNYAQRTNEITLDDLAEGKRPPMPE